VNNFLYVKLYNDKNSYSIIIQQIYLKSKTAVFQISFLRNN